MDELQAIVDVNLPGIICLVETWLNPAISDTSISLNGFCCFRRNRPDGYGGVCAYVVSSIPSARLWDYEIPEVESLWLQIRPFRLPCAVSCILLGVVYHPPSRGHTENQALLELIKIM